MKYRNRLSLYQITLTFALWTCGGVSYGEMCKIAVSGPSCLLVGGQSGGFSATGGDPSSYCFSSDSGNVSIDPDTGVATAGGASDSIGDVDIEVTDDEGDFGTMPITAVLVQYSALEIHTNPSFFDGTKFYVISPWVGAVTVTPTAAASKVSLAFVQYKNSKIIVAYNDGRTSPPVTASGADSGYTDGTASVDHFVSGNTVNISGGDVPQVDLVDWSGVSVVAALQSFNLYLQFSVDGAPDPQKTIGKCPWNWGGVLRFSSSRVPDPEGGTSSSGGSPSTEVPQAPTAP